MIEYMGAAMRATRFLSALVLMVLPLIVSAQETDPDTAKLKAISESVWTTEQQDIDVDAQGQQ